VNDSLQTFTFRVYRPEDAAEVCDLHHRSFADLARSHHSDAQVAAHSALTQTAAYANALAGNNLELAETRAHKIVGSTGWCEMADRHGTARIRKVFIDPSCAGAGLGRQLVTRAEARARDAGFTNFFVRANINAAPFYERLGYTRVEYGSMPTNGPIELPVAYMTKAS